MKEHPRVPDIDGQYSTQLSLNDDYYFMILYNMFIKSRPRDSIIIESRPSSNSDIRTIIGDVRVHESLHFLFLLPQYKSDEP